MLVRHRLGGPGPRSAPITKMLLAGLGFGLIALFAFIGVDHLSAALYTVLIYTYPAMVAAEPRCSAPHRRARSGSRSV